ncbi:TIGR03619 family F420-dependent LLM class oxidoreductase [Streptomyces sp. H10-C2]|uniref:TIGR03619 family F420-dependent LLM class oxidoreductase n=1 Tax=unclassified Streptomyces TaxID=2593676 RepID=UPI0024BB2E23|nr:MULTISPECIES: TIGR03619 family F420-dependent LLM class oxidoreductase [unclassified Streptomyces]MDJ0342400.1 TIGR03619 family F420-dependent LLM class oxidoreductase [Streptomyces sp. PH10-H1]MDJ0372255.1 TIGR03619 family F420-dependent LLM class oxidoreductase [Streptomyces sp. H10-C2]
MRINATIFLTDETIAPVRLAEEVEQRGFAGLFLPEHTHIPVARTTPAPMGEPLPREYGRTLDPFTALAAAAAVTRRITLGTAITLVAQHDPIVLAKQIATLDHLSGGRFTLGVGFGWNVEEAADHGVEWNRRRELVRDRMRVMRALWAPEPTAYKGEFASVAASDAYPKPVGPLRTLVGGAAGPKLFGHIAEYADGWMPIGGGGLAEALPRLREVWAAAGREPGALQVVPSAVRPNAGKLGYFRDLGIEECVVQLPPAGTDDVLRVLDDYAQFL